MQDLSAERPCRILSLDGGGAKGFYTLGVLKGIEGMSAARGCMSGSTLCTVQVPDQLSQH